MHYKLKLIISLNWPLSSVKFRLCDIDFYLYIYGEERKQQPYTRSTSTKLFSSYYFLADFDVASIEFSLKLKIDT